MLWNGHHGFAAASLKLLQELGALKASPAFFRDALLYSVYPDALFMPKYPFERAYGFSRPKCPWRSCPTRGFPCTPSPDRHHDRPCAVPAAVRYFTLEDPKMFGISTHFMADAVVEPWEGRLIGRPEWDYRAKSEPLSDMAERLSREWSSVKDSVVEFVKERLGLWKGAGLKLDRECDAWGFVLSNEDRARALLCGARSLVERRKYGRALMCLLAVPAVLALL